MQTLVEENEPWVVAELLIPPCGVDTVRDKACLIELMHALCSKAEYHLAFRLLDKLHEYLDIQDAEGGSRGEREAEQVWQAMFDTVVQSAIVRGKESLLQHLLKGSTSTALKELIGNALRAHQEVTSHDHPQQVVDFYCRPLQSESGMFIVHVFQ